MKHKNGPLLLLIIAYFAFVTIGMPGGVLNIAWTYMEPTFDVGLGSLGIFLGVNTVGYLFTSFFSGRVIGRLGIGRTLMIGSTLGALGMLNTVLAPTWTVLLSFCIFGSMGSGLLDAGLNTFVSANYSAGRLNWLHAAFGVGATVGPLLTTFIITQGGLSWRVSYAVVLIMFVALIVLLFLTRARWKLVPDGQQDQAEVRPASAFESLRVPLVVLSMALFFVYGGIEVGAAQLTNTLFVDGRGISQETAGFWISFYWLSFTVGRILMGFIADRMSTLLILRGSMVGAVIGTVMLAANVASAVSFLGLALIGISLAPFFATLIADTPRKVGLRHAANTIGFQVGITSIGIAALPGLGGILAEHIGLGIIGPYLVVNALVLLALHEFAVQREDTLRPAELTGAHVPTR